MELRGPTIDLRGRRSRLFPRRDGAGRLMVIFPAFDGALLGLLGWHSVAKQSLQSGPVFQLVESLTEKFLRLLFCDVRNGVNSIWSAWSHSSKR